MFLAIMELHCGSVLQRIFYPYLSISAITERSGQLHDQDGRYLKTRFIDIIVSEGKETKRLTFECGTKIMLILLAKSGVDLSHLEDVFTYAYLKSVYNKVYDKIEV